MGRTHMNLTRPTHRGYSTIFCCNFGSLTHSLPSRVSILSSASYFNSSIPSFASLAPNLRLRGKEMERDEITPLDANGRAHEDERGAGGKVKRPPPRRSSATPYARPPDTAQRRWISKLVDPACRLIAGGATLIFPSFFSKTDSASAITAPASDLQDEGKRQTGEEADGNDDDNCDLHLGTPKSTETANTGDISDKQKSSTGFILHSQDEKAEQSENNKLSEIEQLVKGKRFSREEVNRLMEIINSKAGDLPNAEQGKQSASLTSRKDDKGLLVEHEFPKISNELRQGELNGTVWGSSTPLDQSKVQDDICASPVEIAKAYMGSRALEAGPSSKSVVHNVENSVLLGNEAAIKPYVPSPSSKSSACWPGAVVQDSYLTPQSQSSRYGLYNFPRTPYSRTILSKSKSRSIHMRSNDNRISSTPFHQSQTTIYKQEKSRGDVLEGGYGSVGPIRRIRHKIGAQSSSRSSAYTPLSLNGASQKESSDVHEGFLPTVAKSLEPNRNSFPHKFRSLDKPQGTGMGVPTVHMHTSLMARKILEHIDRNPPTPKEKSTELKLATKWKNPESPDDADVLPNENNGFLKLKDVGPSKYDGLDGKKSVLRNGDQGNSHVEKESTVKSFNFNYITPGTNAGSSFLKTGNDARTSQNHNGSQIFPMKSTQEDALKNVASGGQPSVKFQEKMPLLNSSASKPVLSSISINKPDSKWTFTSDKSSGFTFPVSASSSVFSEPPTPSIMPSFSTGDQNQSKERSTEPSYSFGSKRSSPALVFSFPSTSTNAVQNDGGDIKFSFGSNDKPRLSFSSFSKNARDKRGHVGAVAIAGWKNCEQRMPLSFIPVAKTPARMPAKVFRPPPGRNTFAGIDARACLGTGTNHGCFGQEVAETPV
ncbi:nuclear pore complex protein NUP1 [Senna tora]|uniref:Nuclear pore complex protein NUP1 n=2 Tax=Senna tora TaxID=362788 RepID=A0A834SMA9_9FABA|nr:nuclear pore complex protein NUP1 [Senna tora]